MQSAVDVLLILHIQATYWVCVKSDGDIGYVLA